MTTTAHDGRSLLASLHTTARRPASAALRRALGGDNIPEQLRVREVVVGLHDLPMPGRSAADTAYHGYQLLPELVAGLGGSARAIARDIRLLAAVYDGTACYAPRVLPFLSHFNLAIETVERLGTGTAYQQRCLDELDRVDAVGVLAATELGVGTNILDLETLAVWDPHERELTLHSPTPQSVKLMPNCADPRVPKIVVVVARLKAQGRDEGVWPILVRLRDSTGRLAEGVEMVTLPVDGCGPEMDHAAFRFDGLRVPADALLCGQLARFDDEGRFECALNLHARFHAAIGSLNSGRALFAGAAAASARAGWTITTRYAMQRLTSGQILLADRDGVQRALVSAAARLHAVTALSNLTRTRLAQHDPTAAALSMLAKPLASEVAHDVLETCRRLCGAQGILGVNWICDYVRRVSGIIVAEGINPSLWAAAGRLPKLVAQGRAPQHMDISALRVLDNPRALPWWNQMLFGREQAIAAATKAATLTGVKAIGGDSAATELSTATADRLAADALANCAYETADPRARAILADLAAVFALERIDAHALWYTAAHQLSAELAADIDHQLTTRYERLAENLPTMVDAFDVLRLPCPIDSDDYVQAWIELWKWGEKFPPSTVTETR
ncbi:acyl-CoA dehydrogenase family protein [Nocardia sp. NPDC050710]|uniref:acyl-CoA dehydrogenase family protein n=1 Tax=Nocardia sp. NPDC050710 TaxID=3157220 RepID=UPI0033C3C26C